jgi:hypothetical protein
MRTETKNRRSTSISVMRSLLTFTVAVVLLGLPGFSNAFTCPLMTSAEVQNEPCSHCSGEKPEDSCPVSQCLLICPYTAEKAAILIGEGLTGGFTLPAQLSTVLVHPHLADAAGSVTSLTKDFDSGRLYLLNRVLLI